MMAQEFLNATGFFYITLSPRQVYDCLTQKEKMRLDFWKTEVGERLWQGLRRGFSQGELWLEEPPKIDWEFQLGTDWSTDSTVVELKCYIDMEVVKEATDLTYEDKQQLIEKGMECAAMTCEHALGTPISSQFCYLVR